MQLMQLLSMGCATILPAAVLMNETEGDFASKISDVQDHSGICDTFRPVSIEKDFIVRCTVCFKRHLAALVVAKMCNGER